MKRFGFILLLSALTILSQVSAADKIKTHLKKDRSVASVASSNSYNLTCVGAEPFWSLKVTGKKAVFSDPATKAFEYNDIVTKEAIGIVAGNAFTISGKNLKLSIIDAGEKGCSDGMSDDGYKYHVLVEKGSALFYGCCQ